MERALEEASVAAGDGAYDASHTYRSADYTDILANSKEWRTAMLMELHLKRQIAAKRKKSLIRSQRGLHFSVTSRIAGNWNCASYRSLAKFSCSPAFAPAKARSAMHGLPSPAVATVPSAARAGSRKRSRELICNTLAPILHWRACHVWDWLMGHAAELGFPTRLVADAYGMTDDGTPEATAARTGCVGCNLASRDIALERLVARSKYAYLAPLLRLRPLYAELKKPHNRLRKQDERKADGSQVSNPGRLGPLTMEARRWGLDDVLKIQLDVIHGTPGDHILGLPATHATPYELIDHEEAARIRELMAANTWPQKWTGEEITGDTMTIVFLEEACGDDLDRRSDRTARSLSLKSAPKPPARTPWYALTSSAEEEALRKVWRRLVAISTLT